MESDAADRRAPSLSCGSGNEFDDYSGCGWEGGGSESGAGAIGVSLLEAFEDFEVRAEKRTIELLAATDRQLFQGREGEEIEDTTADALPAHFYWSDQYRLTKPPTFGHWRDRFDYLQAEGRAPEPFDSQDHIQWVGRPEADASSLIECGQGEQEIENEGLSIKGTSCVQGPPDDPMLLEEEFFAWDGIMEETLADDTGAESEFADERSPSVAVSACLSPRASRLEETLNGATLAAFSSTIASMLTPVFKALLLKKQANLRAARELTEANALAEITRQQAMQEETRVMEENLMAREEAHQQAVMAAESEAQYREAERRGRLEQERLAEFDEDEIKIRTLAYTHTREWFQPNKKCFSHRGRQFTYLKPVLGSKEQETATFGEALPPDYQLAAPRRKALIDKQTQQRAQLAATQEWVQGHGFAPDSGAGPHRSEITEQQEQEQPSEDVSRDDKRVRLPLIKAPGASAKRGRDGSQPRLKPSAYFDGDGLGHSSVRAPSKVYAIEPYRIPPPLVANAAAARNAKTRSNQANDRPSDR